MSKREDIQREIYDFLEENSNVFDAPYGILEGMESLGRGKMRTVTFGVSRYLDAVIQILSEKNIILKGQGGLASYHGFSYDGISFESVDELKEFLKSKLIKD